MFADLQALPSLQIFVMVILTHKKLAAHRHGNCRKSYDEIAKALKGNNRKDYLFGLKGGKVLSNKIPKGSNRLKIALRNAANAIGNLKETHLSDFFKRVAYRRGRTAAVSATARKLAVIIWNMIS